MKFFDVVGVGYCALDYLGIVDRYPELDEKTLMSRFLIQGGGITATAMVAVARLGGKARYLGKVGDDSFGREIISGMEEEGVEACHVAIEPGDGSPFSFIVVDRDTGKRTIFATPGNARFEPEDLKRECVVAGKVVHLDAHHYRPALQAAKWANEESIPIVMDAGNYYEDSDDLLDRVDFLIASELFAKQCTGEDDGEAAARKMMEVSLGKRALTAVTLGDRGCLYIAGEEIRHQPAFPVEVVDTTGAGDVFHGAFSFGLSQGWSYPEIVEFASAVAAIKCTKLGGRAGIPTYQQTLAFLKGRV